MKKVLVLIAVVLGSFSAIADTLRCSDEKSYIAIFETQGFNPSAPVTPSEVKLYALRPMRTDFLVTLPCFYGTRNREAADIPPGSYLCSSPKNLQYTVELYDEDQFKQRLAKVKNKTASGVPTVLTSCKAIKTEN